MSSSSHPPVVRSKRRSRRLPLWSVAALAAVGGLALGRFATYESDDAEPATAAALGVLPGGTAEERIAALEAAVAKEPDDATSWRLLGSAYVSRASEIGDPALYASAADAFATATELAPGDPTILVGRGVLALSLHQFAEAEELGQQATDAIPGNVDALGVLVDAQVEMGRYDAAAATLQKMLDARPGLPALARTSYLRQLHGDLDGAKESMRRAIVAGGSSTFDVAVVTTLLGDLHRRSGDLAAARDAYAAATEGAPQLMTAQVGAAWATAASGHVGNAIADLEALVERFPAPTAVLLLQELQRWSGDDQAADGSAELVRAIASLQEEAGQVVDLEMALFEADEGTDPGRAVELARTAHAARPDNVFVTDALAWALFRSGDAAAAAPLVDQALRLGTTEPIIRYHAAEITLAAGDRAAAAEHLEIALRDPWFSFRHHDRAIQMAAELGVATREAP